MLITINILSAMSIVMALFIPYFILLHINNKLRKQIEGALDSIVMLEKYSEKNRQKLVEFAISSNENFEGQDKNWENQKKISKSFTEAFLIANRKFKGCDENFNTLNEAICDLYEKINQKQTLKEILENPIEVTKPACETKLKLKEEVNVNDIKTVTKIKNKFDFECGILDFKKGYTFQRFSNNIVVHRYGKIHYRFPIKDDYTTVLWEKLLKVNEPKPKRKYTKRIIKNQN